MFVYSKFARFVKNSQRICTVNLGTTYWSSGVGSQKSPLEAGFMGEILDQNMYVSVCMHVAMQRDAAPCIAI